MSRTRQDKRLERETEENNLKTGKERREIEGWIEWGQWKKTKKARKKGSKEEKTETK